MRPGTAGHTRPGNPNRVDVPTGSQAPHPRACVASPHAERTQGCGRERLFILPWCTCRIQIQPDTEGHLARESLEMPALLMLP